MSIIDYLLWKFRGGKDYFGLGQLEKVIGNKGDFKWGLKDE